MSAGYPSQKLTLWADFSFLTHEEAKRASLKAPFLLGPPGSHWEVLNGVGVDGVGVISVETSTGLY